MRITARIGVAVSVALMVLAILGFIATLVLNAFFDEYDTYGEVPVPESKSLHLPAGEVTITFHTTLVGGSSGSGLTVPPLGVSIIPPDGVADPVVTENFGSSTTVNNDARRRVWVAQIPVEGPRHPIRCVPTPRPMTASASNNSKHLLRCGTRER